MWIFKGRLGDRDRVPRLDDPEPFWRRHFWPPSAWGAMAIALVLSVLVGFVGALIYVKSEPTSNPVDPVEKAPIAKGDLAPGLQETTTTKPEILSPEALAKKVAPSVWAVDTLDEAGRPVEGSGFIAGSFGGQTYLLTSLSIVRAATRIPGPDVVVRNGGTDTKATLWTWQEERDLALLVIGRTAPSLTWADQDPGPKAGDKVFAPGGGGGGVLSGMISAISPAGIEQNLTVDDNHLGAPLLNDRGQILGILTRPPGSVNGNTTALPVSVTCERVLSCGSGNTAVAPGSDPTAGSTTTTTVPSKGATSTTLPSRSVTTTTLR